jgi:hypothetical protein
MEDRMKRTVGYFGIFVFVFALCAQAGQADETSDAADIIIKRMDELHRSTSSHSEIEMEIITPNWSRTLAMEGWSIGLSKTFIRILSPKKEQGVATLRISGEMWNYLPKTNKVIKVPPSMMMGSWMGSDFTNDDLVKEFSLFEDYAYEMARPADAEEDLLYVRAIPREDLPVVWGEILIAVRTADSLPVWEKYFDEKGEPMRQMNYYDIREFSGKMVPAVMEMVPQTKEGHKTVVRYKMLELNIPVDEEVFTLRNLHGSG